jgi:hypothetical protein
MSFTTYPARNDRRAAEITSDAISDSDKFLVRLSGITVAILTAAFTTKFGSIEKSDLVPPIDGIVVLYLGILSFCDVRKLAHKYGGLNNLLGLIVENAGLF